MLLYSGLAHTYGMRLAVSGSGLPFGKSCRFGLYLTIAFRVDKNLSIRISPCIIVLLQMLACVNTLFIAFGVDKWH
ncbi:hypothetical protein Dm11a5_1481 [Dehalococcoides mccartyi]|uniref:Uncharacterized protein n=1 Tax=Dehalococcoides mccartyi TaxID=61435 RepID=A0A142VDB3_9CHLR|nr:hypothetical protein Dm11a5_1481 [Dehalococcoides mccartyi]